MPRLPRRIACLSTESVEVIYELGEQDRIAGISGFTTRPPRARKEKPRISGFSSARVERILAVMPDLVLAFSDMQGDICRELVKAGLEVHHFNQRSVDDILAMIETVGRLIGAEERARQLVAGLEAQIERTRLAAGDLPRRPKVYFEEWHEPLITGIGWVSELVAVAGGEDIFAGLAAHTAARRRIVEASAVLAGQPDVIMASWCGRKFQPAHLRARPGWEQIPALRTGELHEIKSALILSPGPAAIREGLPQLARIVRQWALRQAA